MAVLNFNVIEVIIIIVCTVFVSLYWYLTKNFDYWKKRNVIYDKPYPIVGTTLNIFLGNENMALSFQKVYNRYPKEDIVGGFLSVRPMLTLRDPDIIKQILVKDFNYFQDRGFSININYEREPLLQHLFLASGDTWKILRQKLSPTFTSGKLKNGFPLLTECGKELQKYLHSVLENNQEIDVKELTAKFTTDVIGTYAFGIKMNSLNDENTPFRLMGRKIFKVSKIQQLQSVVLFLSPFVFNLLGFRITPLEIQSFFIDLLKSVVQSRDNKPSMRQDFVDLLIELKSKGHIESDKSYEGTKDIDKSSKIVFTDELLAAQAFVFFVAGFETSSTTMNYALYELAKNLSVQEKLSKEIDKVMSKYNGQITYESLKEMTYLQMVIDETMRKYPPLGNIDRTCNTPYRFPNSDITLDKEVMINIPVYAIHHDPKYYPEPEKYIPERFTPEEIQKRHPFTYLPFGDGPRACIGLRFAKLQTMVGLLSILQHYSVEVNSKTVPEIKFATTSIILSSDKSIYLTLKPRN